MKKTLFLLFPALLALTGCRSSETGNDVAKPAAAQFVEQDFVALQKGKTLADHYMECFTAAVKQNDFSLLQPALSAKLPIPKQRAHFADQMKWISEKLGVLKEAVYLDVFRKGALCEYVWKLTFEKESGGKIAPIDLPYIVRTVCEPDGEVKILMVGFVVR
ncbi:MAG: hypothetical protein MJ033_00095 [Victivallaceae bacterium]|nr:hypothetical protein [Victivallaceae bacterium]